MSYQSIPLTYFDTLVSPKELNILKTLIPYLGLSEQTILSTYVKLEELINTINLTGTSSQLSACDVGKGKKSFNDLFNEIKVYLDKNEIEMINGYLKALNTIKMYNEYMNINEAI